MVYFFPYCLGERTEAAKDFLQELQEASALQGDPVQAREGVASRSG